MILDAVYLPGWSLNCEKNGCLYRIYTSPGEWVQDTDRSDPAYPPMKRLGRHQPKAGEAPLVARLPKGVEHKVLVIGSDDDGGCQGSSGI